MAPSTAKSRNLRAGSWENTQAPNEPGERARDLEEFGDWTGLEVPAGWDTVARLCRQVEGRRGAVVDSIVTRILHEIPSYRGSSAVSEADLRASVASNLDMMLRGTAEHRGPRLDELNVRRDLGARRAAQGLPVNDLLQAFVVGYSELWNELVQEARSEDAEAREQLLIAAATVWEWVHEVTDAVGIEYHERLRRHAALTSAIRERLFEALLGGVQDGDEARSLAQDAGFDPDGSFRSIAAVAPADASIPETVATRLTGNPGQQQAVKRGSRILILDQGGDVEDVLAVVRTVVGDDAVGVGARREGLHGAALSIGDAERALGLAQRKRAVSHFDADWLAAIVIASEQRLAELLKPGVDAAQQSAELARTVQTFSESGFSMSGTARSLHVHTNTVAYRLARWADLTGWDPRTYDGLSRSLAALSLLGIDSASASA